VVLVAVLWNFASHETAERQRPSASSHLKALFGTVTAHPTAAEKKSGKFEKIAAKADHFCKLVS
jgi:hypothetical protein